MKTYPLIIESMDELETNWSLGFLSRGHHDPATFVAAIQAEYSETVPVQDVRQQWYRLVPYAGDGDVTGQMMYHDARTGARGAFPVTIWERVTTEIREVQERRDSPTPTMSADPPDRPAIHPPDPAAG